MNCGLLPSVAILVSFAGSLGERGIEYGSFTRDDLDLEVTGTIALLPYQAARCQGRLRNVSGRALGPIHPLEDSTGWAAILGPGERPFAQLRARMYIRDLAGEDTSGLRVSWKARSVPIVLADNESVWASKVLALVTNNLEPINDRRDRPLFVEVGEYTLQIPYPYFQRPVFQSSITVEVRQPRGDDATICKQLRADEKLAVVMASPVHVPDEDQLPLLVELVERYPKSSYADYARFAVARYHMLGVGWVMEHRSGGRRAALEVIHKLRWSRSAPRERRFKNLMSTYGQRAPGRDKLLAAIVNRILDAGDHDLPARRKAILELADFDVVSTEERAAAIAEMEQITNPDFPYRPNVLIAMRAALGDTDPQRTAEIEEELNERFPDAVEWLEVLASTMTDAEWTAFRKRVPAEAAPGEPRPAAE